MGALVTAGALAAAALGVNAGSKGGELVFRHGAGVQVTAPPGVANAAAAGADAPGAGRGDDD